ncbi:MAG: DMT family transporter [Cyanobacteria bacterium P01_A01_bin.37]
MIDSPKVPSSTTLWLSLLALSLMWGSAYVFVKISVIQVPPFALTAIRAGIASVALVLWFITTRQSLQPFRHLWMHMVVLGTVNGWCPDVLTAFAARRIDSAQAGMVVTALPLFTALIAHYVIHDEHLTWQKLGGIGIGFIGVFLIIGPTQVLEGGGTLVGFLLMLAATLSYAIGSVYGRWLRSPHPAQLALGQIVFTCLPAAVISIGVEPQWSMQLTPTTIGSVLALGLITTAAANVLFLTLLQRFPATNVSMVSYLKLIWVVVLGWLVLSEVPMPIALVGCAMVVMGVWIVTRSPAPVVSN